MQMNYTNTSNHDDNDVCVCLCMRVYDILQRSKKLLLRFQVAMSESTKYGKMRLILL